jgi:hypothetical protein
MCDSGINLSCVDEWQSRYSDKFEESESPGIVPRKEPLKSGKYSVLTFSIAASLDFIHY